MFEAIQLGNFEQYGRLVGKSWEQNKALDSGTNPPAVEAIINRIQDEALGYNYGCRGGYFICRSKRYGRCPSDSADIDDKPCECKRPPGRNESFE